MIETMETGSIEPTHLFLILGMIFIIGLMADILGRHTPLPRVTLLLAAGIAIGPAGFDLIGTLGEQWFPLITKFALIMIGFLVGGKLTLRDLKTTGPSVLSASIWVTLVTLIVVMMGLLLLGVAPIAAVLLAGIATSTDPVATIDVVNKYSKGGRFPQMLIGVVAIDDAWGLLAFSMMLLFAQSLGGGLEIWPIATAAALEIGGAVLLGVTLGIPMALATGRVLPGEPTQAEALGAVLVCGGLAMYLDVSFLLAAMVLGCVVVNLAQHHLRPFHSIEGIEWPFLILFFVFGGASLEFGQLNAVGVTALAYICLRIVGRLIGGWIGMAREPLYRRYMGIALLPQAGIALGMALVAIDRYPQFDDLILPVVLTACVLFEILGPVFTRMSLNKVRE